MEGCLGVNWLLVKEEWILVEDIVAMCVGVRTSEDNGETSINILHASSINLYLFATKQKYVAIISDDSLH